MILVAPDRRVPFPMDRSIAPTEEAQMALWGSCGVEVTGSQRLPAVPTGSSPNMRLKLQSVDTPLAKLDRQQFGNIGRCGAVQSCQAVSKATAPESP